MGRTAGPLDTVSPDRAAQGIRRHVLWAVEYLVTLGDFDQGAHQHARHLRCEIFTGIRNRGNVCFGLPRLIKLLFASKAQSQGRQMI